MKRLTKNIGLLLMIISLLVISFGCTNKSNQVNEEKTSIEVGFLESKSIEGDKHYISIDTTKEKIQLEIKDKNIYDSLIDNEFYMVSYNEDKVVKSIENNLHIKDLVLNGLKKEPIDNGEPLSEILPTNKINVDNLTLLDSYNFDFDEDGTDETIAIYTAAQKDSNGNIAWDDGQNWLLVVQDEDKDYELFNNYVQLGNINFYVYTQDDDYYISTLQTGTAGLTMTQYEYDKDNNKFISTVPFNTKGNMNLIYSSYGY